MNIINAIRRAWLRWEADSLAMALRELEHMNRFNGLPADTGAARGYRQRLAEIEVQIALLQTPLRALNTEVL